MYAKGMTTGDIESRTKDLYNIDISYSTISCIADKILPIAKECQKCPLEEVYAVMFIYSLKNQGVEDILIACINGITSFPHTIEAVYPQTELQQCIIHQIRNSTKFVSYQDIKKLMIGLKRVYVAPTEKAALNELEVSKDNLNSVYPKICKS